MLMRRVVGGEIKNMQMSKIKKASVEAFFVGRGLNRLTFKSRSAPTTMSGGTIKGILNVVYACCVARVSNGRNILAIYFA